MDKNQADQPESHAQIAMEKLADAMIAQQKRDKYKKYDYGISRAQKEQPAHFYAASTLMVADIVGCKDSLTELCGMQGDNNGNLSLDIVALRDLTVMPTVVFSFAKYKKILRPEEGNPLLQIFIEDLLKFEENAVVRKGDIFNFRFENVTKEGFNMQLVYKSASSKWIPIAHPTSETYLGLRCMKEDIVSSAPFFVSTDHRSIISFLDKRSVNEECPICRNDTNQRVLFLPCCHVMCGVCAENLQGARCSFCNLLIYKKAKLTELVIHCVFPGCGVGCNGDRNIVALPCFCLVGCERGAGTHQKSEGCPMCGCELHSFMRIFCS